jgi:hypothetical protein
MRKLLLVIASVTVATAAAPDVPVTVKRQLDRWYPGWKRAAVAPQVRAWFSDYRLTFQPDHITADFDGDGRADHAVRIEHNGEVVTLAMLDRGGTFERHVLSTDPPDPFTYLLLYRKGEKDFDFTKLKPFRHAHDAIGLMYFEKIPLTFRYIRGKFDRMLSPSDEELEQ